MSWCWLALVDEPPDRADVWASAREPDGTAAGVLAAWLRHAKPTRDARRIDARIIDGAGAAAVVSLVRPPAGVRLPFDDLAVQQARRDALARPPFDALSTLLTDASHFEGSITVARGDEQVMRLTDDPFARIFPARLLTVDAGLFGSVAPPAGPVIERYGSAQPWPWDRYGEDESAADPRGAAGRPPHGTVRPPSTAHSAPVT
jgi:hypothetical protein